MNEQPFLEAYAAASAGDEASQAIAKERARARFAGWQSVMSRAQAGQPVNRAAIDQETVAAISTASTLMKVTSARRNVDGEMLGSFTVSVGSRELAHDRLAGMTDALVQLCDSYMTAGARVGWKMEVGTLQP